MQNPRKQTGEAQPRLPLAVWEPGADAGAQSHRLSPAPCLQLQLEMAFRQLSKRQVE